MSLVDLSINPDAEKEKCIVAQYRTTSEMRSTFIALVNKEPRTRIPIEWVIDIADESNGWFYGTAYHFDDTTNMLHVMVPDKVNPSFDGEVQLDYRTVHLIECVDGKSDALFNKCVRDSIIKVKWELEWFEEDIDSSTQNPRGNNEAPDQNQAVGKWIKSVARFYIRTANQILVEDFQATEGQQGFVMLAADLNVRLHKCSKEKGLEDFIRLVNEGLVQSTSEAISAVSQSLNIINNDLPPSKSNNKNNQSNKSNDNNNNTNDSTVNYKKLGEFSRNLKECVSDLLDEREENSKKLINYANSFKLFALNGDLDEGLNLLNNMDNILKKEKNKADSNEEISKQDDSNDMEAIAEDAWYFAQKLEKNIAKINGTNEIDKVKNEKISWKSKRN